MERWFLLAMLACPALARAQGPDPLAIRVQYPPAGTAITASDSTFVFGEVLGADPADVMLTVNGFPVPVHESGGWIAFIAVEPDSFTFRIRADHDSRTAVVDHTIRVPRPLFAPPGGTLLYRPGTIQPEGPLEVYAGDTLRVSVVAAPGLRVHARIGGREVPLFPAAVTDVNVGRQVWGPEQPVEGALAVVEVASPVVLSEAHAAIRGHTLAAYPWIRYAGDVYLQLGGALGDTLAIVLDAGHRVPVAPITYLDPTVVRVAVLHDDTAGTGRTDGRVIARTGPGLGYELLLPNGTAAATARRAGAWREIALGPGQSAWVALDEVHPIEGPRPRSEIAVIRTRVRPGWSEVVLPLTEPLPFRVEQSLDPARYAIRVYGLVSNVDWIETTITDPLIESVRWSEPENGVFLLDVDLAADQPWGWRAYREGTHLVLGFRHAPGALSDRRFRSRLHGVKIVVDPGHNPDPGAVGPTGLEEREANLAISLELARILEERGAEVVLTRASPDSALGLYDRTNLAIESGGEIFVSIHNNALPDGVNPFVHNGTSVLYYHPQSEPLAEAIQAQLLPRTGLSDHGVWHQNLAVTRMNEMPSVLVEGAFMMIPEQEALLETEGFQRRIAEGVAAGIERFLAERGAAGIP
ncbi:MAG TPA: N-acetylmuramoyl-L-alanine amidase [Gemmatimonadota bacterium]|nr:N-acetylmuramoyl-L-alanine amidase [Gemmatimonadota bacterium]